MAIQQQPNKAAIKESTVAQDAHSVHVFIASALIVATEPTVAKADFVLRVLVLACRMQDVHSRVVIVHVKTVLAEDITTAVVDTRVVHNRVAIAHVTTITVRKAVTNHAHRVDTTIVVDTRVVHSRVAIAHVTTTMRMAINHRPIAHVTMLITLPRARRITATKQIKAAINHVSRAINHVSRVLISHVADTTIIVVDTTTTVADTRVVVDTTTAIVTTTVVDITNEAIVSTVLIMIQMQSIHTRNVSNTRRRTSILTSHSA